MKAVVKPEIREGRLSGRDHLGDDLEGRAAHGLGGLHHAAVHLRREASTRRGHKGEGSHDQRHNGGHRTDGGAQDQPGTGGITTTIRMRKGTERRMLITNIQHRHHRTGQGQHAIGLTHHGDDAQGQTDNIGKEGGDHRYIQGLPNGEEQAFLLSSSRRRTSSFCSRSAMVIGYLLHGYVLLGAQDSSWPWRPRSCPRAGPAAWSRRPCRSRYGCRPPGC